MQNSIFFTGDIFVKKTTIINFWQIYIFYTNLYVFFLIFSASQIKLVENFKIHHWWLWHCSFQVITTDLNYLSQSPVVNFGVFLLVWFSLSFTNKLRCVHFSTKNLENTTPFIKTSGNLDKKLVRLDLVNNMKSWITRILLAINRY